ncbi:putative mitochondrial protein [Andalucia godoyi]|uniref:Putative mitochondrial protein n=1 Tax=Andalucia godoyi TaxID=505711 RepID=A0A8K0F4D6_ANDGO|nr:putative mitochondrial protein [Andalucia godoyi]|eukprot:ANDGO_02534.mRNA.1 putative mitochondrial protein
MVRIPMIVFRHGKRPFPATAIQNTLESLYTLTRLSSPSSTLPSSSSKGQLLFNRKNTTLVVENAPNPLKGRMRLSDAEIKAINNGSAI